MVINSEWLDTQEPGPYVVAVQEAWDRIPSHWRSLLPKKTILFLVSPGAEAQVYNSWEAIGQDGRILITLPKGYDYDQVFQSSLFMFAYTFTQMSRVQDIFQTVLSSLVRDFDFTAEEKLVVYDPDFRVHMFLSGFIASALGFFNKESAHEFMWAFMLAVEAKCKTLEIGA